MLETTGNKAINNITPIVTSTEPSASIEVPLTLKIDLQLLRKQKHELMVIPRSFEITTRQDDAIEGLLNLIDFIQDSIVEQGLASEHDVFPQMPLPFETAA